MHVYVLEAKENYQGMFEIQKSGDKTSSGEIGLDIRRHASLKVGQDQVSGGVRVCRGYKYQMAITHKIYSLRGSFPKLTNSLSHKMYACLIKNEKKYSRQTA